MEFLSPGFLWLLPLALVPLLSRTARHDLVHLLLRISLLALVVLAMARPVQQSTSDSGRLIVLEDQSASVLASEQSRAQELLEERLASLPSGTEVLRKRVDSTNTLGAELRMALSEIPQGASAALLLASDGLSMGQDWGEAAQQILDREIPLSVMPLAYEQDEVRLVDLYAEGELRQGHPARLLAFVDGRAQRARVHLHRETPDGDVLAQSDWFSLEGRQEVVLSLEAEQAGFARFAAVVEVEEGQDQRSEDNWLSRPFAIQGPLQILHLGQRFQGAEDSLARLVGPGFTLVREGSPADFPLVWLDDIQADDVSESFQQELQHAIQQQGSGLLMSGSGAFGPGGWSDTVVEDMLPVSFVQKEEKRDPSTTLCVIIDTSGSMGGNRVQLAKEVSRLAINRLLPHDKVGIVEFYGAKRWAAPIQPASNRIELERALNRLDAGGGTVILPAIEEAWYGMKNVNTRYKHVLVLTDGGVETGPFESVLRRMADDGMNVSTVLIGPETHSEFLVNLANWGKGRFYNVPNRFNLPEVILKQPASARLPAYRPGPHRVQGRGGLAWWAATDLESLPPLDGYVETEARPGAEVLLETVDGGHPVLASWRNGLGRVSAMTASPVGEDTASWQDWPAFGTVLAQALQRTAGEADDFRFSLTRRGREVVLTAERQGVHRLLPAARIAGANANLSSFLEVSADRFEARFPYAEDQELRVLAGVENQELAQRLTAEAPVALLREHQVDSAKALPMAAMAAQSGGVNLADAPTSSLPFSRGSETRLRNLAPWFLALALLLFFSEIYWRRRPTAPGPIA